MLQISQMFHLRRFLVGHQAKHFPTLKRSLSYLIYDTLWIGSQSFIHLMKLECGYTQSIDY